MRKDYRRKLSVKPYQNRKGVNKFIVVDGNLNVVSGISGQTKKEAERIKKYIEGYETLATKYIIKELKKMKSKTNNPYKKDLIIRAIHLRKK